MAHAPSSRVSSLEGTAPRSPPTLRSLCSPSRQLLDGSLSSAVEILDTSSNPFHSYSTHLPEARTGVVVVPTLHDAVIVAGGTNQTGRYNACSRELTTDVCGCSSSTAVEVYGGLQFESDNLTLSVARTDMSVASWGSITAFAGGRYEFLPLWRLPPLLLIRAAARTAATPRVPPLPWMSSSGTRGASRPPSPSASLATACAVSLSTASSSSWAGSSTIALVPCCPWSDVSLPSQ